MVAIFYELNSEHIVGVPKEPGNGISEIRMFWKDPEPLAATCISFPWKAVLQFPNCPLPSALQSTEGSALTFG